MGGSVVREGGGTTDVDRSTAVVNGSTFFLGSVAADLDHASEVHGGLAHRKDGPSLERAVHHHLRVLECEL
eukprot:1415436-Rhodomonas_salina.5